MRIILISVVTAFADDLVFKMLARQMLASGGRFAFSTPLGLIGFVPSHNDVLAFSLPIPNAWIWPVGWVIVVLLLAALHRSRHCESANGSPLRVCARGSERGRSALAHKQSHPPQSIESCEIATSRTPRNDERKNFSHRQLAMAALILGAISNLLDRTLRGGVTDYLSLTSLFPAFNLADLLIMSGVLWWWYCKR